MISTIKVASNARLVSVRSQNSKICINVLRVLYNLGYIRGFAINDSKSITIFLKYVNNKPVVRNIHVISTPGRRVYSPYKKLQQQLKKKDSGYFILSTSKGVITDEESVMFNIGGEVLLKVS
jgi:small subunit ribosomal protein S8